MSDPVDALDPSNSSKNTLKLENTEKRDHLIKIEKKYQKAWADAKIFESDAPTTSEVPFKSISSAELRAQKPKFFGTVAYPYMNGTLHVGHGFTFSKVEFAAGYARMLGKRTLFPLGFHCTGMAIKACADKLVREIEEYGKNFDGGKDEDLALDSKPEPDAASIQPAPKEVGTKFVGSKSKVAAKSIKAKFQYQIMLAQGIPREEIHRFADPYHWIDVFPSIGKKDLTRFGLRIDWRRSFVTTDANPYYDAFVRWQMNRLKELGKIKFGKRYTVYSPKDGQACLDHDRSQGEGVTVQEYTGIKMEVLQWSEAGKKIVDEALPEGAKVYFVPATLRPETMYGQTCCFVGPNITYGIFRISQQEYFFCSDRAARNMAFQGIFPEWGTYFKMAELQGADVIGTLVNAPLSVHKDGVRILPMETVKATKGTGVVTCVPSDSPDDYAVTVELIKKSQYYGIKKEWAELEIIPIIETPSYGNLAAPTLVQKLKINSPKDAKQLAEAKELAYREGFYKGKMIYGDFKGRPVQEAKELVKQSLIEKGAAFDYAEPEGLVISRSADECVAAHLDQWYLNYGTTANGGDGEWCDQVLGHVDSELNTFSSEAKIAFQQTLAWLSQWACARSYGLGSKLPWDPKALVESLSDSTIYQSYYTIAHYLHKDIFGKERGIGNIAPEQMTDEIWDYIFTRRDDVESEISKETLQSMRREFEYWYPVDLRVSGKDLIRNHLTFFLYIHVALFPREFWPRGVRVNGHLLLNGEKMSKSTGNFLTLSEAIDKFGADATRVAIADAGDGMDDANFEESVANSSILKLFELNKWCEEMINDAHLVDSEEQYIKARESHQVRNIDVVQRTGEKGFWDQLFENELNTLVHETKSQYDSLQFRTALKAGFYDFTGARDSYREATKAAGIGMHHSLIRQYISLQALLLAPVAPHWAEHIWLALLHHSSTIQSAPFPSSLPVPNPSLAAQQLYIRSTTSSIIAAETAQQKRLAKGKSTSFDPHAAKKLSIFVAAAFPAWQDICLGLVRASYEKTTSGTLDFRAVIKDLPKSVENKKAVPFIQGLKRRLEAGDTAAEVFERNLGFEEESVLREMLPGLKAVVRKCEVIEIVKVEGKGKGEIPPMAEGAVPGQPTFLFENL